MTKATNHIDDTEPLFGSLDELIAHQRQANQQRAHMAAQQAVERLSLETGLQVRPGVVEALAWRFLVAMNAQLDRDAESIAVAMGHKVVH